ncbi:MAG: hypothetical protein ACT4PE_17605 [Candidatus Eiseniibacteriota bacterium]
MLAAVLLLASLAAPPPPAREHFRDETAPTHVLRITDLTSGEVIRTDGPDSALAAALPLGETARLLLALTGIERARLDPDARVTCDSTCWAQGAHGEPDLAEAIAWSCDSWVPRAWDAVGRGAAAETAKRLGLGGAYHRAHRVIAIAGSSDDGTWVTGTLTRRSDVRWAFALYVRGGSSRLAATRAADLLLETARTYERASSERGGRPLSPLDER